MLPWIPLSAVALALLAAGPLSDLLVQPVLVVAPAAGRVIPGGTIEVGVSLDFGLWNQTSPCVDIRIEQGDEDPRTQHGLWQWVCPHAVAYPVMLAPRAQGTLVIDWNGTVERIPFLVPKGAHATTSVGLGPNGLDVASDGTLVDGTRGDGVWPWVGALKAVAFLAFVGSLACRMRISWMAGLLAAATLLWIPLAAKGLPTLPGWLLFLSWAALAVTAFTRIPDDKPPRDAHGEPLDERPLS